MAFHFQQSGDLAPFLSPPFFWGSYCEESLLLGLAGTTDSIHVFGVRHAVDTWVSRAFDTQPASPYGLTAALNTMFLTPAGLRAPVVAQCHRFQTKIVSAGVCGLRSAHGPAEPYKLNKCHHGASIYLQQRCSWPSPGSELAYCSKSLILTKNCQRMTKFWNRGFFDN